MNLIMFDCNVVDVRGHIIDTTVSVFSIILIFTLPSSGFTIYEDAYPSFVSCAHP